MREVFEILDKLVIGRKPYTTVFSFNYHLTKHIREFMTSSFNKVGYDLAILDVGAGSSPYYEIAKNHAKIYYALDLAESLPKDDVRNIKQVIGTADDLPFEDESIDVIICNQVLEHVPDAQQSVKEMRRVLRKGGIVIASIPHISPIHLEPNDYRRYTEYGIHQLFNTNSLKVVNIEGSGGLFQTLAFILLMSIYLKPNVHSNQRFRAKLHLLLSPINALINLSSLILDKLTPNINRAYSNYCWMAVKQ